jgi:stage V sporulation protein AC
MKATMSRAFQDAQEKKRKQEAYQQLVAKRKPKPPYLRHFLVAFLVGGSLCALGQFILNIFMRRGMDMNAASAPTLAVMILFGIVLTALGVYDEIAEFAGAGAAVPITGFANTVAACAMDFKREGWVLGMGSKMFVIAGPVLVYGVLSGVSAAFIKYVTGL